MRFDLRAIHSTSTPASGSEESVGSVSDRESDGESVGDDDEEEHDPDITQGSIFVPKNLDEGQVESIPETPQDGSKGALQDEDGFGGPVQPSPPMFPGRTPPRPPLLLIDDNEEYEVDSILDYKVVCGSP
ncbi:hypothetical protein BGZ97_009413, partial [Linnemannia gamsii]